jgi:hypothetical protein
VPQFEFLRPLLTVGTWKKFREHHDAANYTNNAKPIIEEIAMTLESAVQPECPKNGHDYCNNQRGYSHRALLFSESAYTLGAGFVKGQIPGSAVLLAYKNSN